MASAAVAQPGPKEPSSGGLLSKFARSPSRKHKPRPSSASIEAIVPIAASKPTRVRPRPGPQRTTTAPAGPPILTGTRELPRKEDAKTPTSAESNMEFSGFALADAVRQPTFKAVKKQYEVPEMPALNATALTYSAILATGNPISQSNPNILYQVIHDIASKRIATLDYMRKAHEGRIFWFNTVHFSQAEVSKLPSYAPARLGRRATNYLLLGMSIPAVLDVYPINPQNSTAHNNAIAQEYIKSMTALLTEFETFQQAHPMDGSTSSLSRARLPQMFKRAGTTRPRKSSGPATEIGMPLQQTTSAPAVPENPPGTSHSYQASMDTTLVNNSFASSSTSILSAPSAAPPPVQTSFPTFSSLPPPAAYDAPNSMLLPNEGPYSYLLTPPLPFTPDFYVVFSTLCDVLTDTYQKLLQLLTNPNTCTPSLSENFTKMDARIRKIMVGGIIREFENSCRDNAKRELMGVQKVVLGGLMGT